MIIVNDLKPGTTFENEGNIFVVLDIQHNKTAMRQMIVKVKVKNLRTGVINEISFTGGDKVEQAPIDKREMQQLYDTDDALGIILPDKVELQIVECEPAVKGDTATSASKMAKLETGLEIRVPLFIEQDEMVVINTADGKYSGRA